MFVHDNILRVECALALQIQIRCETGLLNQIVQPLYTKL